MAMSLNPRIPPPPPPPPVLLLESTFPPDATMCAVKPPLLVARRVFRALGLSLAVAGLAAVGSPGAANAQAPNVSDVSISSNAGANSTYHRLDAIRVEVAFDQSVDVTGTPQLALTIGTVTRQANYASGTGTDTLTFRYTVAVTDVDADGISIGASALALNSGTIQLAGGATAANLGLGTHAISNAAAHKVDGSRVRTPAVLSVALNRPPLDQWQTAFAAGHWIEVTVGFSVAVDVTGVPQVAIGIGTETRQARYASGTGTKTLVFRYQVHGYDPRDDDGISVARNALALNGGMINRAGSSQAALLDLGSTVTGTRANPGARSSASGLTLNSPSSGDTYAVGETIEVTVSLSFALVVVGGSAPQLALAIGAQTRQASMVLGGSNVYTSLTFRYVVQASDADADGLSIAENAITGGNVQSRWTAGRPFFGLGRLAVANVSTRKVDGSRGALVSGVSIGSPPTGDVFERGDAIEVSVAFNRAVDVSGTPQLALGIDTLTRQASYASGSGTDTLVFRYVVASADADTVGISIGANALGLNGGTIRQAGSTTNAVLGLGSHAVVNSGNHKVAGGTFTASSVSGASVTSAPASGDTYGLSERIEVRVTFARSVVVTGAPQLALGIGSATKQAAYAGGSGTRALRFGYVVVSADADADGLSVGASALGLNGGTIADARDGATAAGLGLGSSAISNAGSHKVDGSVEGSPAVAGARVASSPSSGGSYGLGEEIRVAVRFDRAVAVTGTPELALGIGAATRQASYASGSGTAELEFAYVVQATDADRDGLSVGAGALTLNGGTVVVAGGSAAATLSLGSHAIANARGHGVAGTREAAPVVTGARLASSPASGSTYGLSERIAVALTFSRPVDVTGTPRLAVGIGSRTRQASYASGSGTTELTFGYVVASGDADADGVSVAAGALTLNGGTIVIAGGRTAAALGLGTHALSNVAGHLVAGSVETAPAVAGVTVASNPVSGGRYELGEEIRVHVRFDRAVEVTGSPTLALEIGAQTRTARFVRVVGYGAGARVGWAARRAGRGRGRCRRCRRCGRRGLWWWDGGPCRRVGGDAGCDARVRVRGSGDGRRRGRVECRGRRVVAGRGRDHVGRGDDCGGFVAGHAPVDERCRPQRGRQRGVGAACGGSRSEPAGGVGPVGGGRDDRTDGGVRP